MAAEMEQFFPQQAHNPVESDYANHLKSRTTTLLDGIVGGSIDKAEIARQDAILLSLHEPQRLDGHTGAEVQLKRAFDDLCRTLEEHNVHQPKLLTVREFYGAMERIRNKSKKQM